MQAKGHRACRTYRYRGKSRCAQKARDPLDSRDLCRWIRGEGHEGHPCALLTSLQEDGVALYLFQQELKVTTSGGAEVLRGLAEM